VLDLVTNPYGSFLLWFDIGLLLIIFGEYWFTVRKGYKIEITSKYMLTILLSSFLGIAILSVIIKEMFSDKPEFLTPINYIDLEQTDTIQM